MRRDSIPIPVIKNIDAVILAAIEAGGKLEMSDWHGPDGHWCGTTHCRAGWAIHCAGEAGQALESYYGSGWAADMIYRKSRPGMPPPEFFYMTNEEAMADIKKCAAEQTAKAIT